MSCLIKPQILRLFLSRRDRAKEVLRRHHHFVVSFLIHKFVGGKITENLNS